MAFTFKLEQEDGTPADPPMLHTAVPNWQAGDTIPLGADRMLRVIETGTWTKTRCWSSDPLRGASLKGW
jgi:hypothetical protein